MKAFSMVVACAALLMGGVAGVPDAGADDRQMGSAEPAISGRLLYVRGDVGLARLDGEFHQAGVEADGGSFLLQSLGDSPFIGAGVGWQIREGLRVDLTGEYRASADIRGVDSVSRRLRAPNGRQEVSTQYEAELSSIVGLANAYLDLGRWHGITPYIGAGIGFARNKLGSLSTLSTGSFDDFETGSRIEQTTLGLAGGATRTSLAWALMAGASYDLSRQAKLDLGYRYLNLGRDVAATTDLIACVCGVVGGPLELDDVDSHEFRIGVRWLLDRPAPQWQPLK